MAVYITATLLAVFMTYVSVQYDRVLEKRSQRPEQKYMKKHVDLSHRMTRGFLKIMSALPLVLVAGFRYRVGRDYMSYARSFVAVCDGKRGYYKEIGYRFLQIVMSLVTSDYMWMFIACAIIFGAFYYKGIYKNSVNPPMSVALIVSTSLFFSYMNGQRQGLALSVMFYSLTYVFEQDLKKFLICIAIATSLHNSSLVYVIVYFLYNVDLTEVKILKYTVIFGTIGVFGGSLVKLVVMQTKYAHYYQSVFAESGFEMNWFIISTFFLIILILYFGEARESVYYKQYNLLCWMQLIAVIFCLLSASIPETNRILWMFNTGQLLSLPMVVNMEKDKRWRLILMVVVMGFYTAATSIAILGGSHRVLPYRTYFTK